jgi:hypothetical protein
MGNGTHLAPKGTMEAENNSPRERCRTEEGRGNAEGMRVLARRQLHKKALPGPLQPMISCVGMCMARALAVVELRWAESSRLLDALSRAPRVENAQRKILHVTESTGVLVEAR